MSHLKDFRMCIRIVESICELTCVWQQHTRKGSREGKIGRKVARKTKLYRILSNSYIFPCRLMCVLFVCLFVCMCVCVCVCCTSQGLLTDDLLKEKVAECTGFNGKGVTLAGFDELVDKLVRLHFSRAVMYIPSPLCYGFVPCLHWIHYIARANYNYWVCCLNAVYRTWI